DDFLNGVCHVLGGRVQYVTEKNILYTPKNVEVEKELFSYSAPVFKAN
ncbi:MAG: cell division protein SepF, partial [Selenomonadales bacterium]|nr:cell division protein SepF [Selenomonadales bacterium]